MDDSFPAEVKDFIGKHIHSLAQLEILLMMRSEPKRSWTVDEIATKLYLQSTTVTQLLMDLVQRGFVVEEESRFRYQPANDGDRQAIDNLARVYQERRVAVTAEIFSKPNESVKAFADAFRLRREE